ncbi:hypothetical protein ACET3Z_012468 [Daucus carota]
MVRTRSGTEVHVTHPKDAEDEDEGTNGGGANDARDVEMETCGEDENQTTGDETTKEYGYSIVLYVYHVSPANESDEGRDGYKCSDDEFVKIKKDSKEERKKMDVDMNFFLKLKMQRR